MTLRLAAFQHFCARFADAFLTSLNPLTYELGDYQDLTEADDPDYEPTCCGFKVVVDDAMPKGRWFLTSPEAVAPPAASATPAGVCAPSEAPPAGPPIMSLDWIEPAVLNVLCEHQWTWHVGRIECWSYDGTSCERWFADNAEWREHVWDVLRDRLERASHHNKT